MYTLKLYLLFWGVVGVFSSEVCLAQNSPYYEVSIPNESIQRLSPDLEFYRSISDFLKKKIYQKEVLYVRYSTGRNDPGFRLDYTVIFDGDSKRFILRSTFKINEFQPQLVQRRHSLIFGTDRGDFIRIPPEAYEVGPIMRPMVSPDPTYPRNTLPNTPTAPAQTYTPNDDVNAAIQKWAQYQTLLGRCEELPVPCACYQTMVPLMEEMLVEFEGIGLSGDLKYTRIQEARNLAKAKVCSDTLAMGSPIPNQPLPRREQRAFERRIRNLADSVALWEKRAQDTRVDLRTIQQLLAEEKETASNLNRTLENARGVLEQQKQKLSQLEDDVAAKNLQVNVLQREKEEASQEIERLTEMLDRFRSVIHEGARTGFLTPLQQGEPSAGHQVELPLPNMAFVSVPQGQFSFGLTEAQVDSLIEAYRVVQFDISQVPAANHMQEVRFFYLSLYEVTNEQYALYDPNHATQDQLPVTNLSYDQVVAYVGWLNALYDQVDFEVGLPTEREWEYAASGPKGMVYPWGNVLEKGWGNFQTDAASAVNAYPKDKSWCGALGMAGNVQEVCELDQALYTLENNMDYVVRGLPYNCNDQQVKLYARNSSRMLLYNTARPNVGFRLVIRPTQTK